jgi:hypothetical protein
MDHPIPEIAPAFRRLRRTLLLRRLRRTDPILRLELALIGGLIAGYVAWRVRLPLDRLARSAGADAVAAAVASALLACALLGALLAGTDHLRRLNRRAAGPEWPALPLPPATIASQSVWESGLHAHWVLPVAAGALVAALGLQPWWGLALSALAFALLLPRMGRAGAWLARRAVTRRSRTQGTTGSPYHLLATPWERRRSPARFRLPAARWGVGATRALLTRDLVRSLRHTAARPKAATWALFLSLALAVWTLPIERAVAGMLSSALALLAAVMLAEWMLALSSGEPYALLASLPLSAARAWAERVRIAFAATGVAAVLLTVAASPLGAAARLHFVVSLAFSTLLIAVLGVTYGLTLFPRVETAQRLVLLWLVLALAASAMFPLAGWAVLLGALLHALRRLPDRSTLATDAPAGEV